PEDLLYFEIAPRLERGGDLTFKAADFLFGNAFFVVSVTTSDGAARSKITVSKNLTITIAPTNQPPTLLLYPILTVRQESATSGEILAEGLVRSYIPGAALFNVTGPRGEEWSESAQALTFNVSILNVRGTFPFVNVTHLASSVNVSDPKATSAGRNIRGTFPFVNVTHLSSSVNVSDPKAPIVRLAPMVAHGNGEIDFHLTLTDSEGLSSPPQLFTVKVESVNDPPAWALTTPQQNASRAWLHLTDAAWDVVVGGLADGLHVESGGGCEAFGSAKCEMVIEVDENCRDCPGAVGGVACERGFWAEDLFVGKPSLFDSGDEQGQGLSFEPMVAANGSVFFCLREDHNGEARFSLRLLDDGGGARGGIDASPTGLLTIRVLPVNQPPSFALCCSANFRFWAAGTPDHVLSRKQESVASAILRGNLDPAGNFDREAFQNATFEVSGGASNLFTTAPVLSATGSLFLAVAPNSTGQVMLEVTLVDDGGAYGSDRSAVHEAVVSVGDSYVTLDVTAVGSSMDLQVLKESVYSLIADRLGVSTSWVTLRTASASANMHLLVDVFAINSSQAIAYVSTTPDLVSTAESQDPGASYTITASPFRKNYGNAPRGSLRVTSGNDTLSVSFSTNEHGLVLSLAESETHAAQSVPNILFDTVAPEDTPLASDGSEDLRWDVTPLGHRLFLESAWSWDGTDGGLMSAPPTVEAECAPLCLSAGLVFAAKAYWNGEALYEVRMRGTSVRVNLTLAITSVNQPPDLRLDPYFEFSEPAGNETVLLSGAAWGFTSAPVDISDESSQTLTLILVAISEFPVPGSPALLRGAPVLTQMGDGANVTLDVTAHANGEVVLSFLLRDDGVGALDSETKNLTVKFVGVNDAPAWDVGSGGGADGLHVESGGGCAGFGSAGCEMVIEVLEN
ncbi:hypothetical protein T484DRAFT_1810939, partial [Baffinella frigidus]